jgi:hypothetical protein
MVESILHVCYANLQSGRQAGRQAAVLVVGVVHTSAALLLLNRTWLSGSNSMASLKNLIASS